MGEAYQLGSRGKTILAVAMSLVRRLTTCPESAGPEGVPLSHRPRVVTLTVRSVIPGRGRQPASPESISQDCGYGFRARALWARPGMT
jgi:hypothetical protein